MHWKIYPKASDPVLFDIRRVRRTASLFKEVTNDENRDPIFTLKDYDTDLPSAYLLYMSADTEFDAAMMMVGSMGHWRRLLNCSWFMHGDPELGFMGLVQWRRDMDARDANEAMRVLKKRVQDGDRAAAQFLLTYATKGEKAGVAPVKQSKKKSTSAPTDISDKLSRLRAVPSSGEQT